MIFNGVLHPNYSLDYNKSKFIEYRNSLVKNHDVEIELELRVKKRRRSRNQHGLLYKWFTVIGEESGLGLDGAKFEIKRQANFGEHIQFMGRTTFKPKSLSDRDVSVQDLNMLLEKCKEIVIFLNEDREQGCQIILPWE